MRVPKQLELSQQTASNAANITDQCFSRFWHGRPACIFENWCKLPPSNQMDRTSRHLITRLRYIKKKKIGHTQISECRLHFRNCDLRYNATSPHNSFDVSTEHNAFSLPSRTSKYKYTMLLQTTGTIYQVMWHRILDEQSSTTPTLHHAPSPPTKKKRLSFEVTSHFYFPLFD